MLPVDHPLISHLQVAAERGNSSQGDYNRVVYAAAANRLYRIPVSVTHEGKGKNRNRVVVVHHDAATAHPHQEGANQVNREKALKLSPKTLKRISNLVEQSADRIDWNLQDRGPWKPGTNNADGKRK